MVHMPGHIWLVFGEWDMAADVNERAAEVDRHYFATTGVTEGLVPDVLLAQSAFHRVRALDAGRNAPTR